MKIELRLRNWFLSLLLFWTVIQNWHLFIDPKFYLTRDNFRFHYSMFSYIVAYLKYLHFPPTWFYSREGGVWMEILANNYLILMPHRMLGYLVSLVTPIPVNMVYKFSFLIVGQGIFLIGIYHLAKRIFSSQFYPFMVVATALVTSVSVALIHQEQMLGTIFYLPFLWILALDLRKNAKSLVLLLTLLGLSLNSHYPQLLMGYLLSLGITALFCFQKSCQYFREVWREMKRHRWKKLVLVSLVSFLISASPLFYSYLRFQDRLTSPFRLQESSIHAGSYDDYLRFQEYGKDGSSLNPHYLISFLGVDPEKSGVTIGPLDSNILFMTPAIPLILILALILKYPCKYSHLILLVLLSLLSIGVKGPAPKILWEILPGIKMFRQWYHFLPFLDLHLLFLIFIVAKHFSEENSMSNTQRFLLGMTAILFLVLASIKTLSPFYTLVPVVLIGIKLLPIKGVRTKSELIIGLFFLWIFFSSLHWSMGKMTEYNVGLVNDSVREIENPQQLFERTLSMDRDRLIAKPRDFDSEKALEVLNESPFYWRLQEPDSWVAIPTKNLHLEAATNGFKIEISPNDTTFKRLIFRQYNDGNWIVKDNQNRILLTQQGLFNTLEIAIPERVTSLSIQRRPSAWNLLVFLMWSPLIAGLLGYKR